MRLCSSAALQLFSASFSSPVRTVPNRFRQNTSETRATRPGFPLASRAAQSQTAKPTHALVRTAFDRKGKYCPSRYTCNDGRPLSPEGPETVCVCGKNSNKLGSPLSPFTPHPLPPLALVARPFSRAGPSQGGDGERNCGVNGKCMIYKWLKGSMIVIIVHVL